MTGSEIAALKKAAEEEAVRAEKEKKNADRAESDRLRKVAENEGDRLFAAAEAALVAGDIEAARQSEKAATAAYESRNIARTTILRALRTKISDASKAQAAAAKELARLEAKRKAEAAAAEAKRVAEEEAARQASSSRPHTLVAQGRIH
jgi:colicin import membrane protein